MPFYYQAPRAATTNGTGNTCSTHIRFLTVANQSDCFVVQINANVRNSTTAGSGVLRTARLASAGGGGTGITPSPANPNNRASDTTALTDASAINTSGGATSYVGIDVGFAQTGGQGGWVALERDQAHRLLPNGGANGNTSWDSFTPTASQALQINIQFGEG